MNRDYFCEDCAGPVIDLEMDSNIESLGKAIYCLAERNYKPGLELLVDIADYAGLDKQAILESLKRAENILVEKTDGIPVYDGYGDLNRIKDSGNYHLWNKAAGYINEARKDIKFKDMSYFTVTAIPDTFYNLAISCPESLSYMVTLLEEAKHSGIDSALKEAQDLLTDPVNNLIIYKNDGTVEDPDFLKTRFTGAISAIDSEIDKRGLEISR